VVIRRVAEALCGALWVGGLLVLLVLIARPSLYEWMNPDTHLAGFKGFWLNRPFFLLRAVGYVAVWFLFSRAILTTSRRQDSDGALARTRVKPHSRAFGSGRVEPRRTGKAFFTSGHSLFFDLLPHRTARERTPKNKGFRSLRSSYGIRSPLSPTV
jgi:hypothetical protein